MSDEIEWENTYRYREPAYSYEQYIERVHDFTFNDVDVLPRSVSIHVTKIYRCACEFLMDLDISGFDKKELFMLAVAAYRMKRNLYPMINHEKLGKIVAYIYMYRRGVKISIPRNLSKYVMAMSMYTENSRRRFIEMAIQRIAEGDILLHKILAASTRWILEKIGNIPPSSAVSCACKIASYMYPNEYPFKRIVTRYLKGKKAFNYTIIIDYIKRLGISVEKTGGGVPVKVYLPQSLCNIFRKIDVEIPSHAICYS